MGDSGEGLVDASLASPSEWAKQEKRQAASLPQAPIGERVRRVAAPRKDRDRTAARAGDASGRKQQLNQAIAEIDKRLKALAK
jgi:hypothetical protein